jgi:hypothetical protein
VLKQDGANPQVAVTGQPATQNGASALQSQHQNSGQALANNMGKDAPATQVAINAGPPSAEDLTVAAAIADRAMASIAIEQSRDLSDITLLRPYIDGHGIPGLQISPVGPVYTLIPPGDNSNKIGKPGAADLSVQGNNGGVSVPSGVQKDKDRGALAVTRNSAPFDDRGYFQVGGQNNGRDDDHTGRSSLGSPASRKWQMGVMVVPGLSNNAKLNMGYGLSVGYRLNRRLSLNSGLAYAALSGAKDASELQSASASGGQGITTFASNGRALSAIEASITGIKVPLELRYQVNSKIYIGTGVSAMALLSDKVERRYTIAQMQSSALAASSGGMLKADAMQSLASNMKTTEVIPDDEVGAKNVAGFINFSLGLQQPINKNKSISIEPFVSVPMNNHLFNQNIKMTDAGIRIKLGL